jgi:type IV pilus assembly protein PilY1
MPPRKPLRCLRSATVALLGAAWATMAGGVDLSTVPPNLNSSVQPNFVVTLDDSGSMVWTKMGDFPPFATVSYSSSTGNTTSIPDWGGSNNPWRCAALISPTATSGIGTHAMNGVYYNPNVVYAPPSYEDGSSFPNADATLKNVWVDGIAVNRPKNAVTPAAPTYRNNPDVNGQASDSTAANLTGTGTNAWRCGGSAGTANSPGYYGATGLSDGWGTVSSGNFTPAPSPFASGGGPYYYQFDPAKLSSIQVDANGNPTSAGVVSLYTAANWLPVLIDVNAPLTINGNPVTVNGVAYTNGQNFANWYAYYRTRSLMARTSLSIAFAKIGSTASAPIRVAWQNLGNNTWANAPGSGLLKIGTSIIASLDDSSGNTFPTPSSSATAGNYRQSFFNWIYSVGAYNGTPTRGAVANVGKFFQSGKGVTGATNPYWQSSPGGGGQELACRQNYSLLITDGYWNRDITAQAAAAFANTQAGVTLPDGTAYAPSSTSGNPTAIYWGNVADASGGGDNATMSNIAFNFWASNLRPDLPSTNGMSTVAPYFGDLTTGVTGALTNPLPANPGSLAEIYWNPVNDPATWPHMNSSFISLGAGGLLNSQPNDADCTQAGANGVVGNNDWCNLRKGRSNSTGNAGWPVPNGSANNGNGTAENVDDLWHAAVNSRGSFFVASDPGALATQLNNILNNSVGRGAQPAASAPTMSILTANTQGFVTGYNSTTWSGTLSKVGLNATTGAVDTTQTFWEAGCLLTGGNSCPGAGGKVAAVSPNNRIIVTGTGIGGNVHATPLSHADVTPTSCSGSLSSGLLCSVGSLLAGLADGLQSTLGSLLGQKYTALNQIAGTGVPMCTQGLLAPLINGLLSPLLGVAGAPAGCDGLANQRIDYLRGDRTQEGQGRVAQFRARSSVLGAVINSQPVYVSSAIGGLVDAFPAASPEGAAALSGTTYQAFVAANKTRPAKVYVGAADGLLHAFDAVSGQESWAYLPGAMYNRVADATGKLLRNSAVNQITNGVTPPAGVDDTPVVADVFLPDKQWHTVLVGGLRLGGRGLFAIDITNPSAITSESTLAKAVLWDLDNTTAAGGGSATTPFANLGYTYASQNIVRINCSHSVNPACSGNGGTWAVVASSGYFPNTTSGDPAATDPGASQTSLFVIDLATGALIKEIHTAQNNQNAKVTSYGLSTPAAFDIGNNQITSVVVAGDLAGNLWRFDISDTNPNNWSVDLMFQTYNPAVAATIGTRPISTMPVALHDTTSTTPVWIFGTGKYLGKCDATTSTLTSGQSNCGPDSSAATQSLYGIFDYGTNAPQYPVNTNGPNNAGGGVLIQQALNETGNVRSIVANSVAPSPASNGGWQIPLNLAGEPGERVVTTITPVFDSNSFFATTLIPGGNPCQPALSGALLLLNGATGATVAQNLNNSFGLSGSTVSGIVGVVQRQDNAIPTSGSVHVMVPPGGGSYLVPFGNKSLSVDGAQIPHRGAWRQLLDML